MEPWVTGCQTLLATVDRLWESRDLNLIEVGAGGHRLGLPFLRLEGSESVVDEPDGHRSLADRGGDALDRPGPDIADSEDPGTAGLQEIWGFAVVLREGPVLDVSAGEQKSGVVGSQLAFQPLGMGRSADEDEQRPGRDRAPLSGAGVGHGDRLQLALAAERDDLRVEA